MLSWFPAVPLRVMSSRTIPRLSNDVRIDILKMQSFNSQSVRLRHVTSDNRVTAVLSELRL
ncbi:hypothetical protein J6590_039203 [Homalodisca vitripennis]|nr:hypothetical protein J6590_039203 [Homalodisca vitripennis]